MAPCFNMNTPQTDDIARGNHVVPVEWAEQLERQRDEAREKINRQANRIRYLEGATNHACGTPLSVALRERDEARTDLEHWKSEWEIVEARLCGWKHPRDNGIIFEHEVIPVLRKELDEAREEARVLKAILDLLKKDAFCLSQLSDCIEDDNQ